MSSEYAGAGYIVELYQDIEALNGYVAQYKNIIIELEVKYMDEKTGGQNIDFKKINDEERNRLLKIIPPLRHLIINIQLKTSALSKRIPNFTELKDPAFQEKFLMILNQPSPTFDNIFYIAGKYNEVFVDGIIDSLLIQAQSIYQGAPNA